MISKFKVGDKVRVTEDAKMFIGKEGVVTKIGGWGTLVKGAVVTNETFPCGNDAYGEHGVWFPDDWLELVGR